MTYSYRNLGLAGRLGNQLWEIASTIGMATNASDHALFPSTWDYRPYFSIPDKYFNDIPDDAIDGGVQYFQELHYFENMDFYIRSIFEPSQLALDIINHSELYSHFNTVTQNGANPTCSVHVRRGDYLKTPEHFPLPSANYYRRAMATVLDEQDRTEFFVFSDDLDWCKANFGNDVNYVTGLPRPVEIVDRIAAGAPMDQFDLILQTMCDRHIISNSTFSWWGAWLANDTETIYPSRWFGQHPAVRDIPWRKMIPHTWIEESAL